MTPTSSHARKPTLLLTLLAGLVLMGACIPAAEPSEDGEDAADVLAKQPSGPGLGRPLLKNSTYKIAVTELEVREATSSFTNLDWDLFSPPDPQACFGDGACTRPCLDAYTCRGGWVERSNQAPEDRIEDPELFSPEQLSAGLAVRVLDNDSDSFVGGSGDLVDEAFVQITQLTGPSCYASATAKVCYKVVQDDPPPGLPYCRTPQGWCSVRTFGNTGGPCSCNTLSGSVATGYMR